MFGPLTSHKRFSGDSLQSLAMKRSPDFANALSTTGWRPPCISRHGCATKLGRHQLLSAARSASAAETSMRAKASALAAIGSRRLSISAMSSSRCAASAASAWPPACVIRKASSCSSGELNRTAPAIVWRWVKPVPGAIKASPCLAGTSTK